MVPAIKKNLNEIWIETLVKCDGIDLPPLNDGHLNVSEVSTSLITRPPAKSGTMVFSGASLYVVKHEGQL